MKPFFKYQPYFVCSKNFSIGEESGLQGSMSYHTSGKTGLTEISYLISCASTKFPDYWWKTKLSDTDLFPSPKKIGLVMAEFHTFAIVINVIYNGFGFKLCKAFNPIRPGERESSEARMLKIKVNINRLKWNFAWVIIAIKHSWCKIWDW